jgi:uncharacterized repeat protein (TIGR03803 family)
MIMSRASFAAVAVTIAILAAGSPAAASSELVIHDFSGGRDGTPAFPVGLLVRPGGVVFGVTTTGGSKTLNHGTVYRLLPPMPGQAAWRKRTIWAFGAAPDGFGPRGKLLDGPNGSLYGTTQLGGQSGDPGCAPQFIGCGTVFQLIPSAGGGWTKTILHSFSQADGNEPQGGLVSDASGALYGTTSTTIFRLAPPASPGKPWALLVLKTFGGSDGSGPNPDLLIDSAGVLYGTTSNGGFFGHGTVFALTPPAPGRTAGTYMHLHDFEGAPNDGGIPNGGLVGGPGDLWGTTQEGGSSNVGCPSTGCGTVFELVQQIAGSPLYTLKVQHSFSGQGIDGGFPQAGLLRAKDGSYWGTASQGGARTATCQQGCGTVFHPTRDPIVFFRWHFSAPVRFSGAGFNDGAFPMSSLGADRAGHLYGVTLQGGAANQGTAFQVTP